MRTLTIDEITEVTGADRGITSVSGMGAGIRIGASWGARAGLAGGVMGVLTGAMLGAVAGALFYDLVVSD